MKYVRRAVLTLLSTTTTTTRKTHGTRTCEERYLLVLITSTKGTSATAALKRDGNMLTQAPMRRPYHEIKQNRRKDKIRKKLDKFS